MLKILHYALGLSPYRSGGTPAFVEYLIDMQQKRGHDVSLLYPGHYSFWRKKKSKIVFCEKLYKNIKSYEIVNPKLIPLCNGVSEVADYLREYDKNFWDDFFSEYKPDIIHVHTLFGLDSSFFVYCKKNKIKTIFTVHDLFGVCPKTVPLMFDLCKCKVSKLCSVCSKKSFTNNQIYILQSNYYLKLKQNVFVSLVKGLAIKRRAKFQINQYEHERMEKSLVNCPSTEYRDFQNYYLSLIKQFDHVHFNSKLTCDLVSRFVDLKSFSITNILNKSISDNRYMHDKRINIEKIRFLMLGTNLGMHYVLSILDEIWESGIHNFDLTIYSNNQCDSRPYLIKYGSYKKEQLKDLFNTTDLLIFNEVYFSTFSYIILESLSFGVPCLVSGNVGAKDLVSGINGGFVVEKENIKKTIISILRNPALIKEKQDALRSANLNFEKDDFINTYSLLLKDRKNV